MALNYKNIDTNGENLFDFLKEINCSEIQFKVLSFWRQHPKTRMGLGTISRIMGIPREDLGRAMAGLVEKDILTRHDIHGLVTYSLTSQRNQRFIEQLTGMDLGEMVRLGQFLQKDQETLLN